MSRFVGLFVEDDDDEPKVSKNRNKQKDLGPYAVPSGNSQANKKKKKQNKSTKQMLQGDNDDQWEEHDTVNNEEHEELQKAIKLSSQEFSKEEQNRKRLAEKEEKLVTDTLKHSQPETTTENSSEYANKSASNESNGSSVSKKPVTKADQSGGVLVSAGVDDILKKLDSEAKKLKDLRLKDISDRLLTLYRNKCKELVVLLADKNDYIELVEDRLKKAKERNRKFREILSDAETHEKAEILVDMDKVKTVNAELTEEIAARNVELEQVKSRNHELELELKKLGSAKGNKQ